MSLEEFPRGRPTVRKNAGEVDENIRTVKCQSIDAGLVIQEFIPYDVNNVSVIITENDVPKLLTAIRERFGEQALMGLY